MLQGIMLIDMAFLYDKNTYLSYLILFFAALIGTGYAAVHNIEQENWNEGYTKKFWKMLISSLFISLLVFGVVLHYEMAFIPGLILTLIGAAQPDKIKTLISLIFHALSPIKTSDDENNNRNADDEPNFK